MSEQGFWFDFEQWKDSQRQERRQRFKAICSNCRTDILDTLESNAHDWGGYGPPKTIAFECPGCNTTLEFSLEWTIVLESAEPKGQPSEIAVIPCKE